MNERTQNRKLNRVVLLLDGAAELVWDDVDSQRTRASPALGLGIELARGQAVELLGCDGPTNLLVPVPAETLEARGVSNLLADARGVIRAVLDATPHAEVDSALVRLLVDVDELVQEVDRDAV